MRDSLNLLKNDLELFKNIISPLKTAFNFSFGYMKVYPGGYYVMIEDDIDLLHEFILNTTSSSVFCKHDIPHCNDDGYVFTLWPSFPTSDAMKIYFRNNAWNGMTISRESKSADKDQKYIELWWFVADKNDCNASDFFIRNKSVLLQFVHYFNLHKHHIAILSETRYEKTFRFKEGFDYSIIQSQYEHESSLIKAFREELKAHSLTFNINGLMAKLSPKEIEILYLLHSGHTAKNIAQKRELSSKTIQHRIETIKLKLGLHYKAELIGFYEENVKKVIE